MVKPSKYPLRYVDVKYLEDDVFLAPEEEKYKDCVHFYVPPPDKREYKRWMKQQEKDGIDPRKMQEEAQRKREEENYKELLQLIKQEEEEENKNK